MAFEIISFQELVEAIRQQDDLCEALDTYELFFQSLEGVEDIRQTHFYLNDLSGYKIPSNVGFLGVCHHFFDEDVLVRLLLASGYFDLEMTLSPVWIEHPSAERIELKVTLKKTLDDKELCLELSSMEPLDIANLYANLVSEQIVETVLQYGEEYQRLSHTQRGLKVEQFYKHLAALLSQAQTYLAT